MDFKLFLTVFATVFLAELGDKTQLATILFSSDRLADKFTVFLAAAGALVLACAIGVLVGQGLSKYVSEKMLTTIAGIGFILIGIWTVLRQ